MIDPTHRVFSHKIRSD